MRLGARQMAIGIGRREFTASLGGAALAWPLAARAQQTRVWRVGVLILGNADAESFGKELRDGLRGDGYIEGHNIEYSFRSADSNAALAPKLAAELVALKVDVLVALYTPCALAAQQATREIPIVAVSGDPVGLGLVASLAQPGGNITGISLMAPELHGKCVELFHDMLPSARRVAVVGNDADPLSKPLLDQVHLAGRTTGIEIAPVVMVRGQDELDAALSTAKEGRADAVVVQGSLSTQHLVNLSFKHRLPVATVSRSFAEVGGLMSYGVDGPDAFRRGAAFVHKILQGKKPAELPVEQPTKFELVINLKTAKALGLTVPSALLSRADEVIE
jgi:putative tryptophan/tyrosine transport system substrate-binding protein